MLLKSGDSGRVLVQTRVIPSCSDSDPDTSGFGIIPVGASRVVGGSTEEGACLAESIRNELLKIIDLSGQHATTPICVSYASLIFTAACVCSSLLRKKDLSSSEYFFNFYLELSALQFIPITLCTQIE